MEQSAMHHVLDNEEAMKIGEFIIENAFTMTF
jgi:hypothetical protein